MAMIEPRLDVLPPAQQEIWPSLASAARFSYVLYGGTAIALRLGHRQSVDFDFFRTAPLDKDQLRDAFSFMAGSDIVQDEVNSLSVLAAMPSGRVKLSFFGGIGFGRIDDPEWTADGVLLVASLEDLLATKLKAILDRAELRDYRDIAAMLRAGVSLGKGLAGFKAMFSGEPATVLRALGYFEDGALRTLPPEDKAFLRQMRDQVREMPTLHITQGDLAPPSANR